MWFSSRAIGVAVAALLVLAAGGCGRKAPLPRGLDRVPPGASLEDLRRAAPSFHPLGAESSLLVSDEEYLCFGGSGRALALGGGLATVVYRRAGKPERLRACFDETLRRPPPGWTLLGGYRCPSPTAGEARREAFFTIDGRWGARAVDASSGPGAPHVEVAFVADPDVRADARRAADQGCPAL